ncbi:MAG: tetratricopeptide repeat protein [Gemmobacter sp.]|jgi:hypothetical protein|nr:tetratricopeptide repeat protein [Gemmobacter sp.]
MDELADLDRRIAAALGRIAAGLDRLAEVPVGNGEARELSRLHEELEAERAANALLSQRLHAAGMRDDASEVGMEERVARLTRQLDTQGLENQRLRQSMIQLRDTLRALREQQEGMVEPHLINRAMLAELEALRAQRSSEAAELAEILGELAPLLEPAPRQVSNGTEKNDA